MHGRGVCACSMLCTESIGSFVYGPRLQEHLLTHFYVWCLLVCSVRNCCPFIICSHEIWNIKNEIKFLSNSCEIAFYKVARCADDCGSLRFVFACLERGKNALQEFKHENFFYKWLRCVNRADRPHLKKCFKKRALYENVLAALRKVQMPSHFHKTFLAIWTRI
jgi:hypothetical protein